MFVTQLTVGAFGTNCYLVFDEESRQGYVIDPAADGDRINNEIKRLSMKVKGILLTHGHLDHFEAVDRVASETGAPVMMHRDDHFQYEKIPAFFGPVPAPKTKISRFLEHGDVLCAGKLALQVLHTPGHTPGGLSFYDGEGTVFCGDTLFWRSIGRCDLPGGSFKVLSQSIQEMLYTLPEETKVFSGHGSATTIGEERKNNPYV
ncbi:MAG: MBL fold metallo-hydrolase [Ruminococcaceae bacterium]|nr:MBL fold metallo-hydrolase [Oscillospiraceae bacterium]